VRFDILYKSLTTLEVIHIYVGRKGPFGLILETPMVHVEDVARAHIFLLEHSNAKGRYNCSQCLVTYERMSELVYAKYPKVQPPNLE